MSLHDDVGKIMFTAEELRARCQRLGEQITMDYAGKQPVMVTILKGAFVFASDLTRYIDLPLTVDFMAVSSYGDSTETSGTVRIVKDLQKDILDRDVLIVEDIVDTGLTLKYLRGLLEGRGPRSLATCSLLSKSVCRRIQVPLEYQGFDIPNEFVIGYGLDYAQRYRNLPYIGVLRPEIYMVSSHAEAVGQVGVS